MGNIVNYAPKNSFFSLDQRGSVTTRLENCVIRNMDSLSVTSGVDVQVPSKADPCQYVWTNACTNETQNLRHISAAHTVIVKGLSEEESAHLKERARLERPAWREPQDPHQYPKLLWTVVPCSKKTSSCRGQTSFKEEGYLTRYAGPDEKNVSLPWKKFLEVVKVEMPNFSLCELSFSLI